jgi:Uma2 family endonuclease
MSESSRTLVVEYTAYAPTGKVTVRRQVPRAGDVIYPESDGEPMAQKTEQFQWIVSVQGWLEALFADELAVIVAGDLFWYPVEGSNETRTAPDVMVVFGRPKGHRGSYLQWEEANIAPQVVCEILSPGNRPGELALKFQFYDWHGVEEYYLYDPDKGDLNGWMRRAGKLQIIETMQGWVSPRLGVRFELRDGMLDLIAPDGRHLETYVEVMARAAEERLRAEEAEAHAAEEHQRATQAEARAARLVAQLRALGIEPQAE